MVRRGSTAGESPEKEEASTDNGPRQALAASGTRIPQCLDPTESPRIPGNPRHERVCRAPLMTLQIDYFCRADFLHRTQEVGGSSPPSSTSGEAPRLRAFFVSRAGSLWVSFSAAGNGDGTRRERASRIACSAGICHPADACRARWCAEALHRASASTCHAVRWRAKAWRSTSSNANSATPTSASLRSTSKASTTARSSTPSTPGPHPSCPPAPACALGIARHGHRRGADPWAPPRCSARTRRTGVPRSPPPRRTRPSAAPGSARRTGRGAPRPSQRPSPSRDRGFPTAPRSPNSPA
jgi:hypothetical protein